MLTDFGVLDNEQLIPNVGEGCAKLIATAPFPAA